MAQDDPVVADGSDSDSFDDEHFVVLARRDVEDVQQEIREQCRQNYLKHFSYDLDPNRIYSGAEKCCAQNVPCLKKYALLARIAARLAARIAARVAARIARAWPRA